LEVGLLVALHIEERLESIDADTGDLARLQASVGVDDILARGVVLVPITGLKQHAGV
jgi:hypothetical protein